MTITAGHLRHEPTPPDDLGERTVTTSATVSGGDIEIGAVELKDGATDTRAKIGATTAIVAGDNGVAVKDPAMGQTTDAAIVSDANGTATGFLRGLVKMVADFWNDALNALNANISHLGGTAIAVGSGTVSAGTARVVLATDVALPALAASETHLGEVSSPVTVASANFTRPADTTAYASGDLVANSTTAGSVAAMALTLARVAAGALMIRRVRLKKSTTSLTNASFRVHFYGADPTLSTGITNGDNGAWLTKIASYLGSCDVTMDKAFSDAAEGIGTPAAGSEITAKLASGTTVYALIEARGAYTPGNAEVVTLEVETFQA